MAQYGSMGATAALKRRSARKLGERFCHRWHSAVFFTSSSISPSAGREEYSSQAGWHNQSICTPEYQDQGSPGELLGFLFSP